MRVYSYSTQFFSYSIRFVTDLHHLLPQHKRVLTIERLKSGDLTLVPLKLSASEQAKTQIQSARNCYIFLLRIHFLFNIAMVTSMQTN